MPGPAMLERGFQILALWRVLAAKNGTSLREACERRIRNTTAWPGCSHARDVDLRGVPAFVVGAGPSLDRSVGLLSDARDRGLVIVADTAVSAVARHAAPHVCAMVAKTEREWHLTAAHEAGAALALADSAAPSAFRSPSGAHRLIVTRGVLFPTGTPGSLIKIYPTAGCFAAALAVQWGCDPIVLVGMDHAYGPGGAAYSQAITDGQAGPHRAALAASRPAQAADTELPGWGGTIVTSARVWAKSVDWLVAYMRGFGRDRSLINATEGGARFDGFTERHLADVLAELPARPSIAADVAATRRITRAEVSRGRDEEIARARRIARACRDLEDPAKNRAAILGRFCADLPSAGTVLELAGPDLHGQPGVLMMRAIRRAARRAVDLLEARA